MLAEARADHPSDFAAVGHVAGRLGVNPETLRLWKKRADIELGQAPGTTLEAQSGIKRLKKQIVELEMRTRFSGQRACFSPPSSAALVEMTRFIDVMEDRFGVEFVCRTMRAAEVVFVAARGYRAAKARPASAKTLSDQLIGGEIVRLHAESYGVYGVRETHHLLKRQGWATGRDHTGRIMRSLGLRGVKRSKRVFTTKSDPAGARPTDLVQRRFRADAPRRLWVVEVTYVRTWQRFA